MPSTAGSPSLRSWDGTNTIRYTPVQVKGLDSVIALGGRGYHSLAIRSDGAVWTWGWNASGELGNGSVISSNVPVMVNGLDALKAITVSGGYQYTLGGH